jgi:ribonuclease D
LNKPEEFEETKDHKIYPERISKQDLLDLPLLHFPGKIHVVNDEVQMELALESISDEAMLGFDTETRPSFKRGEKHQVALLQLSTEDHAFLFQLHDLGLPESIKNLLTDPSVLKIGVAIHDDIKALQEKSEFEPQGFVELAELARRFGIITTGLRNLTGIFLKSRISKRFQLSNWDRKKLDEHQQLYAATDAWVCLEIYQQLLDSDFHDLTFLDENPSENNANPS